MTSSKDFTFVKTRDVVGEREFVILMKKQQQQPVQNKLFHIPRELFSQLNHHQL